LKKRIQISSTLDNKVATIRADERRLKQILVNLLNNAIKFTPEDGQIGLELEGDIENQVVRLTVWDAGIGIPYDKIPDLFQPFVQLDSTLARKYEGAGLGLALVYRMVEMHGGSISVESEVGKGSRFTVSLPWKEAKSHIARRKVQGTSEMPSTDLPKSSTTNQLSPTVLIAEDNAANLQTLAGYLGPRGYRIILAQNGKEAVERTQKGEPDVIIMDIQMPEMDGLEAIQCIRADADIRDIPIIALTALAMPGDREKCLAAGAGEYLSKPVSLRKLTETLKTLLAKEGRE
jgi:CheY-like chemotaxis protein/anti-sigma regulatory factor (Ser/Thr protein kinase)